MVSVFLIEDGVFLADAVKGQMYLVSVFSSHKMISFEYTTRNLHMLEIFFNAVNVTDITIPQVSGFRCETLVFGK